MSLRHKCLIFPRYYFLNFSVGRLQLLITAAMKWQDWSANSAISDPGAKLRWKLQEIVLMKELINVEWVFTFHVILILGNRFFPAITNPFHLSKLMDLLMHLVYFILSSIASLFCKWGSSEALLIPTASQFQTKKLPLASGGLLPQWDISA